MQSSSTADTRLLVTLRNIWYFAGKQQVYGGNPLQRGMAKWPDLTSDQCDLLLHRWLTHGRKDRGRLPLVQSPERKTEEKQLPLGQHPTVYQAEVFALFSAASALQVIEGDLPIHLFVDALSTLQSLQSPWKQSGLVRECHDALNSLADERPVTVHWIPVHSGFTGNELVDRIAKRATETIPIGPEPILPVSVEVIHNAIKSWGRETHHRRWRSGTEYTDSKKILIKTSKTTADFCRRLSRESLRVLTMIIMGTVC